MSKNILLHLGIDASNIRQGGGVTHLSQMLAAAQPLRAGIKKVTVWAPNSTAAILPKRSWLEVRSPFWVRVGMPLRLLGQQILLKNALSQIGCNVLFSPGGTIPALLSIPVITMSQNLLPFEPVESSRFGFLSRMRLKMWILSWTQRLSFLFSDGIIFLTDFSKKTVCYLIPELKSKSQIISHGIDSRFRQVPRQQRSTDELSKEDPFKLLYVSILMPYKHQIELAQAVACLRKDGYAIQIKFLGASWGWYGKKFYKVIRRLDPKGEYLLWLGDYPYNDLHSEYKAADAFVFASSCENLPNILIEAMASGLPIACSERGPMPEVLGDAGVYFNPDHQDSIKKALRKIVDNAALREQLAVSAWQKSKQYSWERCAEDTLNYISSVALGVRQTKNTSR